MESRKEIVKIHQERILKALREGEKTPYELMAIIQRTRQTVYDYLTPLLNAHIIEKRTEPTPVRRRPRVIYRLFRMDKPTGS